MPKNATINARVDEALKVEAEGVLRRVGVSTTDVITMLLHQIVLRQGIPFVVHIPNAETRAAMAGLDAGKGERFSGPTAAALDAMMAPPKRRKA